jgi:hypothetical protein
MSNKSTTYRVLSSGRRLESNTPVNRTLASGRRLTSFETSTKKQRKSYAQDQIERDNESDDDYQHPQALIMPSRIQISERKPRENEPTKKLLLQAVSDANKSVLMKLNTNNGLVKVMKPDGTTECLTTKTLAKRLKAKEPTWVDPTSLINRAEPTLSGKMKIRVRNEYYTNNEDNKSNDPPISPMEFQDDDEDDDDDEVSEYTRSYLYETNEQQSFHLIVYNASFLVRRRCK